MEDRVGLVVCYRPVFRPRSQKSNTRRLLACLATHHGNRIGCVNGGEKRVNLDLVTWY